MKKISIVDYEILVQEMFRDCKKTLMMALDRIEYGHLYKQGGITYIYQTNNPCDIALECIDFFNNQQYYEIQGKEFIRLTVLEMSSRKEDFNG